MKEKKKKGVWLFCIRGMSRDDPIGPSYSFSGVEGLTVSLVRRYKHSVN
jgi:hypothetical protein